jgi:hypothetical protein
MTGWAVTVAGNRLRRAQIHGLAAETPEEMDKNGSAGAKTLRSNFFTGSLPAPARGDLMVWPAL